VKKNGKRLVKEEREKERGEWCDQRVINIQNKTEDEGEKIFK
jgi:hypothetical protein